MPTLSAKQFVKQFPSEELPYLSRRERKTMWQDRALEARWRGYHSDIVANGIQEPVAVVDGKLRDGHHRVAVALEHSLDVPYRRYTQVGEDEVAPLDD